MITSFITQAGSPYPLGSSQKGEEINFALFSQEALTVTLCIFSREQKVLIQEINLSSEINKTGFIWHIAVKNLPVDSVYMYKITPQLNLKEIYLLDPYAKSLDINTEWGKNNKNKENEYLYRPFANLPFSTFFDWGHIHAPKIPLNELIIYEMPVRAFTQHTSSGVSYPGSFLGIIEKIPHLLELGINAIELLPVHEFNECEYSYTHPNVNNLFNSWGYSPVNFFSAMNRYATSNVPGAIIHEFKTLVKNLHENGIEIILDVVFNHTAEGDETGPIISFKGIDNSAYYLLNDKKSYLNYSGCGNTINANHPHIIQMIVDCLCYWVEEMHVDGFRFDLASALTRDSDGNPLLKPPLFEKITTHPLLSMVKLIVEPWDAGGLYQIGHFASQSRVWSEWNDKYRDGIRRFIKGSQWANGEFATRVCGSQDIYGNRGPCNSINFITSHDGFSLNDLVSYNTKHNIYNGEGNRDGNNDNQSWNCGVEGITNDKKILALRERQMKNFHLALMLSQGIPMITMGDEYGHTKMGNNNTWCQDNALNWFLWDKLKTNESFYRFFKFLIHFRKQHVILRRHSFLNSQDIDWHGFEPFKPDWNSSQAFVAFTLKDHQYGNDLFVAFNAQDHGQQIKLPPPSYSKNWYWIINTGLPAPFDLFENKMGPKQNENFHRLISYSAIVLESR